MLNGILNVSRLSFIYDFTIKNALSTVVWFSFIYWLLKFIAGRDPMHHRNCEFELWLELMDVDGSELKFQSEWLFEDTQTINLAILLSK